MDTKRVEEFIFEKMKETNIPGMAIGVVKNSEVVYEGTFGFRDVEKGLPVEKDTFFGIGSITKSFTCLAVMKLHSEGKLSISDPVSKYIPFELESVRIHHLMSHTSGIPALGYAEATIRYSSGVSKKWYPIATPEDVLRFMKGVKDWHLYEPGKRWFYLNEGYEILGMIVEKVTGMSFKDYLMENVIGPLNLDCVFLEDMDPVRMAKPYVVKGGRIVEDKLPLGAIGADGGLACSLEGLLRYTDFYLGRGKRFIPEELIEEMEDMKVELPYSGPYGRQGYGYGLISYEDFFGRRITGHGGSILVYTAHFVYSRRDGVGVVVLANWSGYSKAKVARFVLADAIGEDPEKLPFRKLEKVFEKLVGRYRSYMGTVTVKVSRIGDFLKLEYEDSLSEPEILVPEDLDGDVKRFYTLSDSFKYPVEFFEESGKMLMVHERFLYEKEG